MLQHFYTAKEITNKIKRQPTESEKYIFVNHISKMGLMSTIYK